MDKHHALKNLFPCAAYRQPDEWARKAILTVARMGRFSSDRTIREYAQDIWHLPSLPG